MVAKVLLLNNPRKRVKKWMLHTIIEKNSYQDSIVLMLLTNHLEEMEGVNSISVMMGTPANKDIFKTDGLVHRRIRNGYTQ